MKPWYRSKTLWFNVVSLAVIVAGTLAEPSAASDPRVVAAAGLVVTVGNAILRLWFTTQPLTRPVSRAEK